MKMIQQIGTLNNYRRAFRSACVDSFKNNDSRFIFHFHAHILVFKGKQGGERERQRELSIELGFICNFATHFGKLFPSHLFIVHRSSSSKICISTH